MRSLILIIFLVIIAYTTTEKSLSKRVCNKAKVVINERDGTIVTGGDVKISRSMISREGVIVEIGDSEKKVSASVLKESSTVKDLVDSLNAIGIKTRDMISILKALKTAGALHAELIIK